VPKPARAGFFYQTISQTNSIPDSAPDKAASYLTLYYVIATIVGFISIFFFINLFQREGWLLFSDLAWLFYCSYVRLPESSWNPYFHDLGGHFYIYLFSYMFSFGS